MMMGSASQIPNRITRDSLRGVADGARQSASAGALMVTNFCRPAPPRVALAVSAAHVDLAYIDLRTRRFVRRGIHRIGRGA